MTTIKIETKLRRDGYIHIPKRAQAALGLNAGDAITVILAVDDDEDALPPFGQSPLDDIVGMFKGTPKYASDDHDTSLYRSATA